MIPPRINVNFANITSPTVYLILFEYIQKQTLADGTTGRVGFDEMGDRIYAEYQIVNVQRETKVTVGYYNYSNVSVLHFQIMASRRIFLPKI